MHVSGNGHSNGRHCSDDGPAGRRICIRPPQPSRSRSLLDRRVDCTAAPCSHPDGRRHRGGSCIRVSRGSIHPDAVRVVRTRIGTRGGHPVGCGDNDDDHVGPARRTRRSSSTLHHVHADVSHRGAGGRSGCEMPDADRAGVPVPVRPRSDRGRRDHAAGSGDPADSIRAGCGLRASGLPSPRFGPPSSDHVSEERGRCGHGVRMAGGEDGRQSAGLVQAVPRRGRCDHGRVQIAGRGEGAGDPGGAVHRPDRSGIRVDGPSGGSVRPLHLFMYMSRPQLAQRRPSKATISTR